VFEYAILGAADTGVRFFDFGISNENSGKVLNEGLYGFKSEFGCGGVVHEFYEIDLGMNEHGRG
jgi:lipid II:glycine glycyltransferase (peptidoglycan interpeptide bridge formation enzyme)